MKIAVIGAGAWGTTLANLLAGKGYEICLWVRERDLLSLIKQSGENQWFLPGVTLEDNLSSSSELDPVLKDASYILLAVPSQFVRSVLRACREILPPQPIIVCASKGIEKESLKTMSYVVQEELQELQPRYAILSGPSFAKEVSRGLPTAVTLGCRDKALGQSLQEVFSSQAFRVYYNSDVTGVELGGALKNVMAIAAGISDGLQFGTNARAALITRGLAEMSRMGIAMKASQKTFMGLSGMGDLVLTCTGDLSRNRQVGYKLGQGEKLSEILNQRSVAEGVKTAEAVYRLGKHLNVELPITEQVYQIIYQGKNPALAVRELLARELKEE